MTELMDMTIQRFWDIRKAVKNVLERMKTR